MATESASYAILVLEEKVAATNVDRYRALAEPYFTNDKPGTVVVDLGRVRICDSAGLRLLINLSRSAAQSGKKLVLYRPEEVVSGLLRSTNLTHVFTVLESLDGLGLQAQ